LARDRIRSIAIIGPDAWPAVTGGGGSSQVSTYRAASILTGVSDFLGDRVRVLYAQGLLTPEQFFKGTEFDRDGADPGIRMEVFDTPDFTGPAAVSSIAHADQWAPEMWTPKSQHPRSVRWSAKFTPKHSGLFLFLAGAGGDDQYSLYVDGKRVIQQQHREGQAPAFAELPLEAGRTVAVRLDYLPYSDHLRAGFGVRAADDLVSPEARAVAAAADVVLVCVGFSPATESEGFDRSFTLPWGQDDLISAAAAANPRTVVAITSGGAVDMSRWLSSVPGLIQLWYPGQEGGTALAEILFGARSPQGKLPATFDRSWEESPVHDSYYPEYPPDGTVAHVRYAEGVFLGYRAYTSAGRKPLFPFGFGLSYTTFSFSGLRVSPPSWPDPACSVSFEVRNSGAVPGAEVAQLYVGDPSAKVKRPVKELKGFEKILLAPGESRRVVLKLDRRSFAYFDETRHAWRVDPGRFQIAVGDSSEDTPLAAEIILGTPGANTGPYTFGP
jgi:beta-glucosidase